MKGPGKGKTNNHDGRPKGIPNRTTKEAKEMLEQALYGQMEKIGEALNALYEKDQARYLDACSKLFTYILPKKTETDVRTALPFKVIFEDATVRRDDSTEESAQ